MNPGRPPHQDPPVRLTLSIPSSINNSLISALKPTGRPVPYGAVSSLITDLIRGWLRQEKKETCNNDSNRTV